ncbi:PREDICTED: NECAP-like protein CG9132 [Rhagoletis zephyria]|uniref:NECAP-like protein CG9132 n=1 Tax=Rhagoletis zephyria TaxID=28612 RepID=UPI0008116418|nr:PREDICTED: NECAP-like protein CG9132 [Rhagoletis zephyria]
MADDYERVLLVKPEVQVYRIPPRTTNRAYRASDWSLDAPDWACRLRLIAKGSECFIKLDEKSTGQFFGQCPIDKYPGTAIESVSDSSRYFVLKLVNEQTKRTAFVGIGFVDRSDSFDLNVALQDHFKILQMESDSSGKEAESSAPKLDLGFKEGQTIKVNLNIGKKSAASKPRPKGNLGAGGILLPPPPGANKAHALPNSASSPTGSFGGSSSSTVSLESTTTTAATEQHSSNNNSGSAFHQQLLDELESLSVTDSKSTATTTKVGRSGVPLLTPANSVCLGDEFALFSSPFSSSPPPPTSAANVISANGSSGKKTDDDLWSDFESFRNENASSGSAAAAATASATTTNATNAKFDDWAKF